MAVAAIVSAILTAAGSIMQVISAFISQSKEEKDAKIREFRARAWSNGMYYLRFFPSSGDIVVGGKEYRFGFYYEYGWNMRETEPYVLSDNVYEVQLFLYSQNLKPVGTKTIKLDFILGYDDWKKKYLSDNGLFEFRDINVDTTIKSRAPLNPGTLVDANVNKIATSELYKLYEKYVQELGGVISYPRFGVNPPPSFTLNRIVYKGSYSPEDLAYPYYALLSRYVEKHADEIFTGNVAFVSESQMSCVWTPDASWKLSPQSFYDRSGNFYTYSLDGTVAEADRSSLASNNTRYSTFYGESVRSVQDKQAVDAAQELLDEAERNSAAMRLQEISVAEQAAKDKASADRRRWILVLIGSGAIGYWIYRRYFKNKRR